jgi:signal transduction histidine kinase
MVKTDARILLVSGLAAGAAALPALGTVATATALTLVAAVVWQLANRRPPPAPIHVQSVEELRLRAALQLRDDALANTVHELRTPLTAVMTALEMMRAGFAVTDEDRSIFLDQATVAGQHMAFLINDLLDIAAIDAGKLSLHVRPLHVEDLAADIRSVMGLMTYARASELVVEPPPEDLLVHGDRSRVLQVLFNMISNAVKYSPHDTPIVVRCQPAPPMLRFEVHDRGIGVPPELREKLFERFGLAKAKHAVDAPSTGLGLHLCQLLVAGMAGQIGYEPRQGGGSVFWFALPLATEPAAAIAAPQTVNPSVPAA